MSFPERRELRKHFRERRRQIGENQQASASEQLLELFRNQSDFLQSRKIAFYLAVSGEINPALLMTHAEHQGKECYLPVFGQADDRLKFVRYRPGDPLIPDHFNILQPVANETNTIEPSELDLVFVPLVAFDSSGCRLGMGKGYYDRTFAFKKERTLTSPKLVGLAHECQRVEKLQAAVWDVPLEAVATPDKLYITQ